MLANGFDVAVIENHVNGNPFENTYAQARHSYYGGGGTPNAWFDGTLNSLGGLPSGSMYSYYLPLYNQRIAIQSNFTMELNGTNNGLDFTVVVTMENVEPYAGNNLVLQFTTTESHIPHNWGSLSEANHVNRFMVPDQNGTPLDFSGSSTQSIMLEFSMDPSWVVENCEFVAFIQDNSTKEILQGTKVAVPDLMPLYYDNAECLVMNMVPVTNCAGEVAPTVAISNQGSSSLTSLDINYQVNEEDVNTYQWTGDLGYGETESVNLPAATFTVLPENDLLIYSTNPNGNPDEDPTNDTIASSFVSALEVVPAIHLYLKLDENPGETTWELINSAGEVLYSGGPYSEPNQFIQETFPLTEDDCYTFMMYDESGDGLTGNGFFALRESDLSLIYENEEFEGTEELVQFSINQTSISNLELTGFNVYPNPFESYTTVDFMLNETNDVVLEVYNVIGEVVYQVQNVNMGSGNHSLTIDTQELASGIYFVNLQVGEKLYTKKITSH